MIALYYRIRWALLPLFCRLSRYGHDLIRDHLAFPQFATCRKCHRTFEFTGDGMEELHCTDETGYIYECHVERPYGFVPEGGCPIHD